VPDFDPTHSSRKTARERNSGKQREIDEFDAASTLFRGENDSSFSSIPLILEDSRAVLHLAACRGESPTSC
jgi:hypothetical protein